MLYIFFVFERKSKQITQNLWKQQPPNILGAPMTSWVWDYLPLCGYLGERGAQIATVKNNKRLRETETTMTVCTVPSQVEPL